MKKLVCISFLLASLLSLSACAENISVPNDWKHECAGRYEFKLPGPIDLALSNIDRLIPRYKDWTPAFKFSDESEANYGDLINFNRGYVTKEINFSIFEKYQKNIISNWKMFNDRAIAKGDRTYSEKFPLPTTLDQNTLISIGVNGATVDFFKDERIFSIGETDSSKVLSGRKIADSLIERFSSRKINQIPSGNGICVPFGFIKDDGSKYRNVGVAMRLIDHPDVEIFFKDTNATTDSADKAPQFKGSRGEVEFFWSYYGPSFGNQLQGTLSHYHDVKLGEYTGKYAFATIARSTDPKEQRYKDGESESTYKARIKQEIADGKRPLDYGFMAYYKGDPTKSNEPDLMLYVIRTASRAVAAGKQPVSEEELKLMALQIAASVKRRPVK
jgi:hypothetical protein